MLTCEQALQFLQKDYELKVRYLSDQFSRMWTRFNFFLVLESGLSAALWVWFGKEDNFPAQASVLAWVGAVSTVCWYVFGAQDRYLVHAYRRHVQDAGGKVAEKLGLRDYLGSAYVYVGYPKAGMSQRWYEYVYQWRCELLSTTKLAAWFALLVTGYWIFMIVLIRRSDP
jgi:hypothetical protein